MWPAAANCSSFLKECCSSSRPTGSLVNFNNARFDLQSKPASDYYYVFLALFLELACVRDRPTVRRRKDNAIRNLGLKEEFPRLAITAVAELMFEMLYKNSADI